MFYIGQWLIIYYYNQPNCRNGTVNNINTYMALFLEITQSAVKV